jgi:ataxia telangiectasia mutated family protein
LLLTVYRAKLTDGGYHNIFEALFKVARAEKQAYLVAKSHTQKSKAEEALTTCSDVLRMAIKASADKLKSKTVRAIIGHVTQLLPVASGEYCPGLSQFYLKVLGSVLEHEAHVEHLEHDDWISTVDFCLEGIDQYNPDDIGNTVTSSRTQSSLAGARSSSAQSTHTRLSLRTVNGSSSASHITKRNSEELLQCLQYLVSASNAPVFERAEGILNGIMHFLGSHGHIVGAIHQVAFSALNFTLAATNADKTSLCQLVAVRLVPMIAVLWSSKYTPKDEMLNSVKDEMLITIIMLRLHMEQVVKSGTAVDFEQRIEDLEAVLRSEYGKRFPDNLHLLLDDLDMTTIVGQTKPVASIYVGILRLRPHSPRAERGWAVLNAISLLRGLQYFRRMHLTIDTQNENDDEIDSSRHPRKRRRIAQRIDGLTMRFNSPELHERVLAFQSLFVLLPRLELSQQDLHDILERLVPFTIDRQGDIGSWAMLCIAR